MADPTSALRLNIGCGVHYAAGWTNTDVISRPEAGVTPDVVTPVGEPLPFEDGGAQAIMLGHVLEHIPWDDVHSFLLEVRRVAAPSAHICVVGPDTLRALHGWKAGTVDDPLFLDAILENEASYQDAGMWPGTRHCWNCHEARVLLALRNAGMTGRAVDITSPELDSFPVTSRVWWQFAILVEIPCP
jgi:hypothetical protein